MCRVVLPVAGAASGSGLGGAASTLFVPGRRGDGGCGGCCGGRLTVFAVHTPLSTGRPQPASLCFRVHEAQVPPPSPRVTFRRVVAPLRGPGQSPALPFACCVGSLRSVGRCGRCSCWCRFRVRGAQSLVCRGCAECGGMCRLPPHPHPPARRKTPLPLQPLQRRTPRRPCAGGTNPSSPGAFPCASANPSA